MDRKQAKAAGIALSHVSLDRAVCSGYPRTQQTAEYVLAAQPSGTAPALEIDSRLVEVHGGDYGHVKSRAEMAAKMAFHFDIAGEPGASMLPGGEAFADAMARSVGSIERLLGEPGWHTMLIAAHEGINRLILGWASGGGLSAVRAFEQDTACINVLDFDMVPNENGGTKIERVMIKAVNLTPYNYVKHGMNMNSLEAIFARDPA